MAKAVLVDLRKCIGCRACQVACKRWNDREATNTVLDSDPMDESAEPFTADIYFRKVRETNRKRPIEMDFC